MADLKHVLEKYIDKYDDANTPTDVRALRESICTNLKELHNFHAKCVA